MSSREDMSSSNHSPGFFFKKKSTVSYSLANFPGEQPCGLCCLFRVARCHTKRLVTWVWGGRERFALVISPKFFFCFVFRFLALFFLLFLFFSAAVSVLLFCCLFSAVFSAVTIRSFLCVLCSCCLAPFVFGRDSANAWFSASCPCFFALLEFFFEQICVFVFCCVFFCILFAVLFRPVSFFCL